MAIAFVAKTVDTRASGVNSDSVTLNGVTSGALLILTASCFSASWDGTISVSGGGTWALAAQAGSTADGKIFIYYCASATGGNTTVTVDPNGTTCDIDLTLSEWSGAAASPLDVAPTATTGTSTAPAISSGTLAQADELIVAITTQISADTTLTIDGTYTEIGENESNTGGQCYNAQYKIVSSTSSDTADWTLGASRTWYACLASFKASGGGGGGGLTVTDRGSGSHNTSGTSFTLNVASNCTAGATIVLCLSADNSASGGTVENFTSVTDSIGNQWSEIRTGVYDPGAASAGVQIAQYMTRQGVGTIQTGTTITVTLGNATVAKAWTCHEVSGSVGYARLIATGVNTGAASGTPTVTTSSVTDGDAVIGWGGAESADTWAGDADTTNGTWSTHQHAAAGTGASGMSITSQAKVVTATATQTYNPTLTSADVILGWTQFRETLPSPGCPSGGWW
jgi:hypothetical protein